MLEQTEAQPVRRWRAFTLFAGVILPSLSITVETTTHICAEQFFDPIPTLWHVLLVLFVPLSNLQVWLAVSKGRTERGVLLGFANIAAIGISLFYTIVYIPLLPLAAIALLLGGLGLLPMAPIFSLASTIIMRKQLKRIAPGTFALRIGGLVTGLALTCLLIVLIELPASLTRMGLQMAASESAERRAEGLRWLRVMGDRDYMLRACYGQSGYATDLVGYLFSLGDPVRPEEAREIYYRVTGETFNTSVPPERVGSRLVAQDSLDFDPDQGGTVIAGKVKGLTLAASRIDGSADADAGVGYLEWTLVFRNDSAMQQEARAQVLLPPGAVVSRLTLWIDGQEREAAFAGRSQARQAYQRVVSRRRDPVLVTTAGRDRIMVQCFPVQPQGGEMKLRMGITVPLVLEDGEHGRLLLPHILDRNFRIPDSLNHAVWVEARGALQSESPGLKPEQPAENLYGLRGTLTDSELLKPSSSIRLSRNSSITEAWTRNPFKPETEMVRQVILEKESRSPSSLVLVMDTSGPMEDWSSETSAAVRTLPPNLELKLLLAGGNGLYDEGAAQQIITGSPTDIARQIENLSFGGGADNVPALAKAWDIAAASPGGVIVWVHGPQLLQIQPAEDLRQRWERRPEGPTLYAVQTSNGPDRVEERLDGIGSVRAVVRAHGLQSDLEKLFAQLTGRGPRQLELIRSNENLSLPPDAANVKETSAHLARLWANDEVSRLMATRNEKDLEEATRLAVEYQLVTPVSGAVVLETKEQYAQAGLQPVEPGTVPTIPEPEMVMLIAVLAIMLLWMLTRRKGRLRMSRAGAWDE